MSNPQVKEMGGFYILHKDHIHEVPGGEIIKYDEKKFGSEFVIVMEVGNAYVIHTKNMLLDMLNNLEIQENSKAEKKSK